MATEQNPKGISVAFTVTLIQVQSQVMQDFSQNIKYTRQRDNKILSKSILVKQHKKGLLLSFCLQ